MTQRLDAVTQAIDAGQYGQADLERDAQAGLFADAPEAVRTFTRAITQRHDREEARQLDLQRVNDAQAGKAVLDPAKPEDVAAVDTWWTARRDADPKGALTDAAAIARRTRILPDAARRQILDALTYGTPDKQAEAAQALNALNQDAPAVAEALPLAARTRADVIGRALAQGRDPTAASAIAEQVLGPAAGLAKDAARVAPMGPVTLLAGTGGEGGQLAMAERQEPPVGDPGGTDPAKRYDPTGGPIDLGAKRFFLDTLEMDDATFREEAAKHGFNPDRMTLFRDIYLGRGSVQEIREKAKALLGDYWAGQLHRAAERAALMSDRDTRMKVLEDKFKITRAGREDQDKFDELVAGVTTAAIGAVAAAKIAKSLFPSVAREVVREARSAGDHIREKLGMAARRLAEDATLLPLEPIAEMARRRFEETRQGSKSGKNKKALFTPADFGKDLSSPDAIQTFVEAARAGVLLPSPNDAAQLTICEVDPVFTERLKADTGVDVTGMSHIIETSQINHAFDRHGPGKETDQHQVPISPEAMSTYVNVVENYDKVQLPRKKGAGTTIAFEKRINGTVVVVQQVRSGKGDLAFFDMWIRKN